MDEPTAKDKKKKTKTKTKKQKLQNTTNNSNNNKTERPDRSSKQTAENMYPSAERVTMASSM